jgi:hypothetical protein
MVLKLVEDEIVTKITLFVDGPETVVRQIVFLGLGGRFFFFFLFISVFYTMTK